MVAAPVELMLDARHLQLLSECGVTLYVPHRRAPNAIAVDTANAAVPSRSAAQPPASTPAVIPADATRSSVAPVSVPPVSSSAGLSFGARTMRFSGPADAWSSLRSHLLRAFAATESVAEAEVMLGGRGSLLTLPALGALAANPALKRQAWMALRALRRSAQA